MSGTVHLERSFSSLADLRRAFVDAGCEQVLIKMLSPHQDNEKNQVYLGTDDLMLSLLPRRLSYSAASESTGKRHCARSSPCVGDVLLRPHSEVLGSCEIDFILGARVGIGWEPAGGDGLSLKVAVVPMGNRGG